MTTFNAPISDVTESSAPRRRKNFRDIQHKKPDSAALMKKYGVKRTKAGVLLFPCTITPSQEAEVREALKR